MPGVTLGDTVADCRIDAVAGRGGMGVVYRATQLRLDRSVALKAILPEMAADAAYRARFQRESRLAASIEHPNVLPVYEAGELQDGSLYLVMRWVAGIDLGTLLRRQGRLDAARAVALLTPVARALDAAHARGLVHRDVKPANVLIAHPGDAREHVYLTDFGIARGTEVDHALTRTGVFVGTLAYAAPERIGGEPGGPASDIYSLGCVLFEALTGHLPYVRTSELEAIHAHLHDGAPSARAEVETVPDTLDDVIRIAMSKDPAQRFASGAEMAVAMEATLDAPPVQAAGTAPRPPAASREGRRLPWIVGGVTVVVLAGLVIALVSGGGGAGTRSVTAGQVQGVASPALPSTVRTAVITQLGAGQDPGAVAPLGQDIAVSEPSRDRLVIVHADGRPPSVIAVGRRPTALAVDPTGRVWVVDAGSGDVRVVDPGARRTLATIPVGTDPSSIAIGGGFAWVADAKANDVVKIDGRTWRPAGAPVATGGTGASGIAYDPSGTVWVANRGSSDVTSIRTGRAGVPHYVPGGPESIAASAGAWVGTASGAIVHLTEAGRSVGAPLTLHGGRVTVSTVGGAVWAVTTDDATLRLLPATGPQAGRVRIRHSLSPAETPAQLSCGPRACVVSDTATRFIVAARF